jgi:hypothetical protein
MFTINGHTEVGRRVMVTWWEPEARKHLSRHRDAVAARHSRGLEGDDSSIITRAVLDESLGQKFAPTPEGPVYLANLDDAAAAFVQLTSYFVEGYETSGYPPVLPLAVPVPAAA